MSTPMPFRRRLLAAALLLPPPAVGAEPSLSGFGTVGYAWSDQPYRYQRFIDQGGTFNRDSLLGLQMDLPLGQQWSATLQAKVAPALDSDSGWQPSLTWAFLSWRPDNDWLLRLGRLRLPLLLYSANSDVGTSYEFARLPTEVYSLTPTSDVDGVSFNKTWLTGEREWALEGYLGTARTSWRVYLRDGVPPQVPAGASFEGVELDVGGLVLSMRDHEDTWRIGVHQANARLDYGPVPAGFPFVSLLPGIGYYQVSDALPGPGVPKVNEVENVVLTFGADIALPEDFRLVGEYARRRVANATLGTDTHGGYLALLKQVGSWTPYVYFSAIRTDRKALDLYTAVNGNHVPVFFPGADAINGSQRLGADMLGGYDQDSFALGASYALSTTSRIKAEWMRTRTGAVSSFVDVPAGQESGGRRIDVFSLSYSFTF